MSHGIGVRLREAPGIGAPPGQMTSTRWRSDPADAPAVVFLDPVRYVAFLVSIHFVG